MHESSCSASDGDPCAENCCVSTTDFVEGVIADDDVADGAGADTTDDVTPVSVTNNMRALGEFVSDSLAESSIAITTEM